VGIFSRGKSDGDDDEVVSTEDDRDVPVWLRRRSVIWTAVALLVVVVAFGCWLGLKAQTVKANLEQARNSAQLSRDALLKGDAVSASNLAGEAQSHAQAARDAAHAAPWNVAAAVPWLGSPFETGQQICDVVLGLTADVLKPTADAGATVAPDQLLANGRLNVQALRDEQPTLGKLSEAAGRLNSEAQQIAEPRYLTAIADARSQLQSQTADLAQLLENTDLAARLAPSMMGADGPRTYFMAFQTNAEARGTGGLLGGYGLLKFDDGRASVNTLGSNSELTREAGSVDLPEEFIRQYGITNPTSDFRNSNQSAHFPYAAQIWRSMWEQQTGMNVDGVIAIDPVALSYMLDALGPVQMPDGETVTKDNVVELTESTAYVRFPNDQPARKQYLQDIASEVVKKMMGPIESPRNLLDAFGRAVSERRISVWSSSPADQTLLEETPLAHIIPDDPAPFAAVVLNNLGGNKMDYYLDRQIEYVADGCDGDTRMSTVTVRLTNTLTAADAATLPDYVAGKLGFPKNSALNTPQGTMLTAVRLLATKGANVISVLINGKTTPVFRQTERGHPSFEADVSIPPGKTAELTFRLSEPTALGAARVPVQPLADEVDPKVSVPVCAG
jgi:hypothetical protein